MYYSTFPLACLPLYTFSPLEVSPAYIFFLLTSLICFTSVFISFNTPSSLYSVFRAFKHLYYLSLMSPLFTSTLLSRPAKHLFVRFVISMVRLFLYSCFTPYKVPVTCYLTLNSLLHYFFPSKNESKAVKYHKRRTS